KGGPASSWIWHRPISKRATSWSRPTRTQLDAAVRGDHGPGHGGGRPDDPWRGDRTGVRLTGRRRCAGGHPADSRWTADPRARNRRVRRDSALTDHTDKAH